MALDKAVLHAAIPVGGTLCSAVLSRLSADDYCTLKHDGPIVHLPWHLHSSISLRKPIYMKVVVLLDVLLSIYKFEGIFLSTSEKKVL